MNFDYIENLSEQEIMELYKDVTERGDMTGVTCYLEIYDAAYCLDGRYGTKRNYTYTTKAEHWLNIIGRCGGPNYTAAVTNETCGSYYSGRNWCELDARCLD